MVGAERRERLLTLARESDRIALEFSLVAAGFAETDECEDDGFESPIAWIKANCHMSGGAAADRVCAGEQLDRLDRSEAAVLAGEIGFAHFAHIARASAAVGERLDETTLLRHAGKEGVAKFRETCIHARHAADPQGVVDEEVQGVEARELTLTDTDYGMVAVSGMLDKVGGAALRTALEPLARRMGKDDHRLFPRRLADALVDLSMNSLDNGKPSSRPNLQITASLETLLGLAGAPAAEMEFSLPISAKAVERFACDCSVTRILLGRLRSHRRRQGPLCCLRSPEQGVKGARLRLRLAGLRPPGELDLGAPSDPLDPWWIDRPRQPRPSLLSPSLDGSRG